MLRVFIENEEDGKMVKFVSYRNATIVDTFLVTNGENCIDNNTFELSENDQKQFVKWLIHHVDFL